jgi:uncharacterized protein YpmB
MPKKEIIDEQEKEGLIENKEEDIVVEKKEPKKKAHTVILTSKGLVWYEVSKTAGYSTTPDIWNGKLKVGDTIYLSEE